MVVSPGPQSITWLNENYFKVIQHGKGDKPDRLMLYNMYGEEVLRFDEDVRDVEILDKQLLLVEKTKGYRDGVYVLMRSEEHTSELQSRENLVCRLLLE